MRPGITGWAQVRYTYGATAEDALQKLQYDLFYIKHLSIALDLYIILSTRSRRSCCGGAREPSEPRTDSRRPCVNAMSVDVEDYFHVSVFDGIVPRIAVGTTWRAACAPTPTRLLDLFDGVQRAAARSSCSDGWPSAIRSWSRASPTRGHEIASHGYAHRLIYDQTPAGVSRGRPPREAAARGRHRRRPSPATARRASR